VNVVAEEICTRVAPMAIKNTEKGTLWPVVWFFIWGFHYVQNNAHSVLIVVPNYSLVSVCSIASYNSIFLYRALSWLKIRQLYIIGIWFWLVAEYDSINVNDSRLLRFRRVRVTTWSFLLKMGAILLVYSLLLLCGNLLIWVNNMHCSLRRWYQLTSRDWRCVSRNSIWESFPFIN
jgi:hypothetical protein